MQHVQRDADASGSYAAVSWPLRGFDRPVHKHALGMPMHLPYSKCFRVWAGQISISAEMTAGRLDGTVADPDGGTRPSPGPWERSWGFDAGAFIPQGRYLASFAGCLMTTDIDSLTLGTPEVDPHHERRWLILLLVLIAQVMILIDATVINVALASPQKTLHFSNANREWVITAYVLAFGSLLPLGGRLADRCGRKRMFLIGLVGFVIFSALAGAAPDAAVLVVARTLQDAFAAALAPTVV